MTLPAFAAKRRAPAPLLLSAGAGLPAAVYQYLLPTGRSAANPPTLMQQSDGTDRRRRADTGPLHRPYFAYTMWAVPIEHPAHPHHL